MPGAGTMAYLDRDVSIKSGRSHASSARSRPPPLKTVPSGSDMFSAASSGVMSMLKTSTDSGDIGDLSFNTSRLPSMPRPAHRRRTNTARLSTSSHQSNNSYTPSQISKRNSNAQAWDAVSAISQGTHGTRGRHGPHGSLTSLQTMQTLPPYASDVSKSPPKSRPGQQSQYEGRLRAPFSPDGRSYSLTQPQPPPAIKPHRSATSLRSQGSGPYPPQRNPYAYPSRLRRPGYRVPSPALSDFGAPPHASMYGHGSNMIDAQSFDPNLDRGHAASQGHLYPPSARLYNGFSQRPVEGSFYPPPQGHPYGRNMRRPPMLAYNSDYAPGTSPVPRYNGHSMHPRRHLSSNLASHPNDQHQQGFRSSQVRSSAAFPMPPYGPTHLPPPRLYTPQAESMPSSSERGSSGPPSSNPPTPKDSTTVQVTVDPIFIDPAFSELQDDQTEGQGFPNYLKYAERVGEIYEMDAAEPAASELPTEPEPGRGVFVRRIKDLLEDRSNIKPRELRLPTPQQSFTPVVPSVSAPDFTADVKGMEEPVELPTTRTSSFREPVELPTTRASSFREPVELPTTRTLSLQDAVELPVTRTASTHLPVEMEAPTKLTRDLIKANTAPSSSDQNTAMSQPSKADGDDGGQEARQERQAAPIHQIVDHSEDISVTIASFPPHRHSSTTSIDITTTSRDFSEAAETDYAIQLNIPGPIRPDPVTRVLPETMGITRQLERPAVLVAVSPLRPGEEAIRDSLVSPLHTQTLHGLAENEHVKVPGSFPNEQEEPPSPQSRPMSGHLSTDISTRFSLPPDLSLLNDQDVTSEPVTDVAVRFSIPRTADHGKPHLVSVITAAEPQAAISMSSKQVGDSRSLRESFFNVEKVKPLHVKKPDIVAPTLTATDSTDLSSFIRRSFPRRQSAWPNDRTDSKRYSSDSTTETRFPGTKCLPGHLPGLKEESQEDMSIKDYRSSGLRLTAPTSFNLKPAYDGLRRSEDNAKSSYLPTRAPRMTLTELRNIPSLNFSRLDLIDKLNEALDIRSSRSVEAIRRRDLSGIYCPSPLRPSSTEALRERYTSFFAKPEEFKVPESNLSDTSDEDGFTTDLRKDEIDTDQAELTEPFTMSERPFGPTDLHAITPSLRARSPSVRPLSRPLSPEELINVAHEVDRLSVPSVAALSKRLSEMLPSIKHLMFDSAIANDTAVRETLDEIHQLGYRSGSDPLTLVRSSTGLRQMAAAADDIATNGTHDSAALNAKLARLIRELPTLPEDIEKFSLSDSGLDRNTTLGTTEALSVGTATDLEVLKPALLRVKSLNDMDDADKMHPGFPGSATKRSLAQSAHHSRPWNLDEYYPWNGDSVNIDIGFPKPILRRNTSASTVLRMSKVSGDSSSETSVTRKRSRARSPLADQSTMLFDASPTIESIIHGRKISKRSLIGSLSRRIGLGGNKTLTKSNALPALSCPTRPGDRYPSTALLPPLAFNLDEVRSFFSDSTSDGSDKRGSFRKHINILRSRLPGGPAALSASRINSIDAECNQSFENHGRTSLTGHSASLLDGRFTEPSGPQNYDGMVGMGKVEFRVKRVTERLRHVLLKTGEMFRTFSHKSKPSASARRLQKQRERAEWLDDSLYSGT